MAAATSHGPIESPGRSLDLLGQVLDQAEAGSTPVFLVAEEVGAPGRGLTSLIALFRELKVPLALAVVPSWLSEVRVEHLTRLMGDDSELFTICQHGRRLRNHQVTGRPSEFGSGRSREEKRADLLKGRERLEALLGGGLAPVFSPPWGRLDLETLLLLREEGFAAVARPLGEGPGPLEGLAEATMSVLVGAGQGARRQARPGAGGQDRLAELAAGLKRGLGRGAIGVRVSPRDLDEASLELLRHLLIMLKARPGLALSRLERLASGAGLSLA